MNTLMPVGFILATADSRNPSTYLGGTWVAIQDRTIVGVGTHALDWTDGSETHTLTEAQLPSISGTIDFRRWNNVGTPFYNLQGKFSYSQNTSGTSAYGIAADGSTSYGYKLKYAFGSGNAHNNLQPSVAKYLWQRTA